MVTPRALIPFEAAAGLLAVLLHPGASAASTCLLAVYMGGLTVSRLASGRRPSTVLRFLVVVFATSGFARAGFSAGLHSEKDFIAFLAAALVWAALPCACGAAQPQARRAAAPAQTSGANAQAGGTDTPPASPSRLLMETGALAFASLGLALAFLWSADRLAVFAGRAAGIDLAGVEHTLHLAAVAAAAVLLGLAIWSGINVVRRSGRNRMLAHAHLFAALRRDLTKLARRWQW